MTNDNMVVHVCPIICPITHEEIITGGLIFSGHIFEYSAIKGWLLEHDTNPVTNEKLYIKTVWKIDASQYKNISDYKKKIIGNSKATCTQCKNMINVAKCQNHIDTKYKSINEEHNTYINCEECEYICHVHNVDSVYHCYDCCKIINYYCRECTTEYLCEHYLFKCEKCAQLTCGETANCSFNCNSCGLINCNKCANINYCEKCKCKMCKSCTSYCEQCDIHMCPACDIYHNVDEHVFCEICKIKLINYTVCDGCGCKLCQSCCCEFSCGIMFCKYCTDGSYENH